MKKLICGILLMVLMAGMAVMQPAMAASEDVAATLKGLEDKWALASLNNDAAGLSPLLADGFLSVTSKGAVRTKAELLESMTAGTIKLQTSKIDDMRVVVYGDTAVVVGRWQGKGSEKGKAFDEAERFTDTWVKQNGQWRCVASQGTLIAK